MKTNYIHIIGIHSPQLASDQLRLLSGCNLVVAGKRLLRLCKDIQIQTQQITPLNTAFTAITRGLQLGNVAVLASGDPLFFGIGSRILREFGKEQVVIHPALSSMQLAFARFQLTWEDAKIISLHGRDHCHIPGLLLSHHKTFVFTDPVNSPAKLATDIIRYLHAIEDSRLLGKIQVFVGQDLGSSREKIFSGSLEQAATSEFSELSVMCLRLPERPQKTVFGLAEKDIRHSRGLITKNEVRAATLHRLTLPAAGIFWDIGAGSGSISIEAARMNPGLTVYAIERKDEELANIRANIRRHGCYNCIPVPGSAPDILASLPAPHRIFIGGSSGRLAAIIEEANKRLPAGGLIVANGVIEKTIEHTPKLMNKLGLTVTTSRIQSTRTDQNGRETLLNPITIIAGEKFV